MATFSPFNAVIPSPERASDVASLPYDVMSNKEALDMVRGNPLSFVRVTRSEVDLPADVSPYSRIVYQQARENYISLKETVPMPKDSVSAFYVYQLEMNGRRQTGVAACAAVDEYDDNVIKKHEKTRQQKEDDRTQHILTVGAQTGPVFLTYRDTDDVREIVRKVRETPPLFSFVAEDGVTHSVWRVERFHTQPLEDAFAAVPCFYIADGHHRAASASRARAACRAKNQGHTGKEDYNFFLAVAFPATELTILPYNRVVSGLNGYGPDALLQDIGHRADIGPASTPEPKEAGVVHMYLNGQWWRVAFPAPDPDLTAAEKLDASILQNTILHPLLGINDPRINDRIDFIGGIRGTRELEERVDAGDADIAFSMYPTTVEQLMAISDAGDIMPPKSTWFEPKLRDGLLVHDI
ncbi:MAG: DUF1015 family protein [Candidatus Pacebacteria bacterium]|nr:DUF1015 family protein [Candidatus Paceibacterota bacterium]